MRHNGLVPRRLSTVVKKAAEGFGETATKLLEFPALSEIKNPAAVALGKLGGSKDGTIRATKLSPEKPKEIAQPGSKG